MAELGPFRVPPEVPRYFADKSLRPAFSWLDVWGQEHAYAFTVAKATDAELLSTFKSSIQRAIDAGQGFETWRQGLRPELERLGWAGPRRVADPGPAPGVPGSGDRKPTSGRPDVGREPDRVVNFTAPGRLQTIFSANMRSARAAGQWERIQRSKGALPYLLYVRTTSARPRPQHLAWAGTILPADDPWWATHFPPNGWRCKCAVRQVSSFERDELVGRDGYWDERPPSVEREFRNRRTGEVSRVPDGIDPGWAHNPGLARARTLLKGLEARLEEAGPDAAKRAIGELWRSEVPATLAKVTTERLYLPAAYSPTVQARLGTTGPFVGVSTETFRRKTGKPDPGSRAVFRHAQSLVDAGALVDKGPGGGLWAAAYIGRQLWRVAIKRSAAGFAYVATLGRIKAEQLRGVAIPRLPDDED